MKIQYSNKVTGVILAGGFGTRLQSLVSDVPKPMAAVNGRPFLEYLLDYWIDQGISSFIIIVGYKYEHVIKHFGSSYAGCSIKYVIEEFPLGTGGGILFALSTIGYESKFLIINGDTLFKVCLLDLLTFHNGHNSDLTLSMFRSQDNSRYMGIELNIDNTVKKWKSRNNENGSMFVNGGVYLINGAIFKSVDFILGNKYSLEDDFITFFLANNAKVYGLYFDSFFIDIGIPDDYIRAQEIL